MKRILILLVVFPLIYACNNNQEELEKLKQENEQLKEESVNKEDKINDFFKAFNEIEENLSVIKEKERLISKRTLDKTEFDENSKDRINNDIELIYDLMKENKRTILRLQNQLRNSNIQLSEFEKMIKKLTEQLEEKDVEIELLREELMNMNFALENLNTIIDTLYENNVEQGKIIDKQVEELNRAYYAIGTEKELKENNVISKKGGIVGIGSVEELKKDFNKKYFTEVDIREKKSILINKKKVEVITSHPKDSYKLIKDGKIVKSIEIKDSEKFWEASKFLVIVVN